MIVLNGLNCLVQKKWLKSIKRLYQCGEDINHKGGAGNANSDDKPVKVILIIGANLSTGFSFNQTTYHRNPRNSNQYS